MSYNVKEVAEKIGMSVHNVRYYTNMDLVPSLKHDKNGNRIFDETSVNYLICIQFLRKSGMSISDIKHYFELCEMGIDTFPERYAILMKLQEQSDKDLEQAIWRNKCIHAKLEHCKLILEGKETDDCNPLNWE